MQNFLQYDAYCIIYNFLQWKSWANAVASLILTLWSFTSVQASREPGSTGQTLRMVNGVDLEAGELGVGDTTTWSHLVETTDRNCYFGNILVIQHGWKMCFHLEWLDRVYK